MDTVLDPSAAPQTLAAKPSIAGLGREGLRAALAAIGVPDRQLKMRVGQLWGWMYVRGATAFADMSDVSKELRATLSDAYSLDRPPIVAEQVSVDGTRKWLLRLPIRGHEKRAPEIEAVYIPEEDRGTLCISSQVGCTLTCSFCHTGTQRLVRNLEPEEIVGQVLLARDRIGDWPAAAPPQDGAALPATERKITNVVLMGMGEPLYNFASVRDAMAVVADGDGLAISKRRITLSTSGVVPETCALESSGLSPPSPGDAAPAQSPMRSRASRIWPTTSAASRLRTSRCVPVWQKEQVSVQPTWLEMHSVPRSASGM